MHGAKAQDCAKGLLSARGDTEATNNEGQRPMDIACSTGDVVMARLLGAPASMMRQPGAGTPIKVRVRLPQAELEAALQRLGEDGQSAQTQPPEGRLSSKLWWSEGQLSEHSKYPDVAAALEARRRAEEAGIREDCLEAQIRQTEARAEAADQRAQAAEAQLQALGAIANSKAEAALHTAQSAAAEASEAAYSECASQLQATQQRALGLQKELEEFHKRSLTHAEVALMSDGEVEAVQTRLEGSLEVIRNEHKVRLQREKNRLRCEKDQQLCSVCLGVPKCILLTPCNHICVCEACGDRLSNCPMCKTAVQGRIKVYL